MKINKAKYHVRNAYEKKVPLIIWGSPGLGKSSIVHQVAKELEIGLIDLRLPQLEPPDLRGIPVPNRDTKVAEWFYPEFLPKEGKGILFLDEIEKAPVATKNAALQLILDRRIGSYKLPDGWGIVAAGNHEDDGCFSQPLGSALCNRMMHIEVVADYDAWLSWAHQNDINETILGYLAFRPDHLYKYDPGATAFPSPRSWEMLSRLLNGVDSVQEQNELLEAVVGRAVGTEYRAWHTVYKHVNVEEILRGKMPDFDKVEKNKEQSFIYAVTTAVAHYIDKRNIEGSEANIAKFVQMLIPEMRAVFCKQVSTKQLSKLVKHPSFRTITDELIKIIFNT